MNTQVLLKDHVVHLNEQFQYAFDYEYWVRLLLARYTKIQSIPMVLLSKYRLHRSSLKLSLLEVGLTLRYGTRIHQKRLEVSAQAVTVVKRASCYTAIDDLLANITSGMAIVLRQCPIFTKCCKQIL